MTFQWDGKEWIEGEKPSFSVIGWVRVHPGLFVLIGVGVCLLYWFGIEPLLFGDLARSLTPPLHLSGR